METDITGSDVRNFVSCLQPTLTVLGESHNSLSLRLILWKRGCFVHPPCDVIAKTSRNDAPTAPCPVLHTRVVYICWPLWVRSWRSECPTPPARTFQSVPVATGVLLELRLGVPADRAEPWASRLGARAAPATVPLMPPPAQVTAHSPSPPLVQGSAHAPGTPFSSRCNGISLSW